MWKMFLPMACSTGRARSSAATSPPTMKVSVPAAAPATPPDTGASSIARPRSAAALATRCALAGAMVLQSMTSAPAGMAAISAPSPRYRLSTCRLAGSIEITTAAPSTAASADGATVTPASRAFCSASALRSKAETAWPFFARLAAIGPPMWPRPMKATRAPPELFVSLMLVSLLSIAPAPPSAVGTIRLMSDEA